MSYAARYRRVFGKFEQGWYRAFIFKQRRFRTGGKIIMEIEENNKLIAVFMGCTERDLFICGVPCKRWGFNDTHITDWWVEAFFDSATPYHNSWDWLMPVVEKIQSMGIKFIIGDTGRVKVYSKDYDWWNGSTSDRLIDCVWYAVVAFIEWQNKKKENN